MAMFNAVNSAFFVAMMEVFPLTQLFGGSIYTFLRSLISRLNDIQSKRFHDHFLSGDHLEKIIRATGFVDVNVRTTQIFMGAWGKGICPRVLIYF
jgi:hypothetical protein